MDILLIRHAEPHADTVLTELGFQQAERLAEYLRDVRITHIYCSPLARARKTMEAVARGRSIEPVILDWLRERRGDIDVGHSTWTTTRADLAGDETLAGRIDELMLPQVEEVVGGFNAVLADHGYHRDGPAYRYDGGDDSDMIAMFAHGGLIQTLLAGLLGFPLPALYAAVHYRCTGITHLTMMRRRDGPPELQMLSFCALPHLGAEGHFAS